MKFFGKRKNLVVPSKFSKKKMIMIKNLYSIIFFLALFVTNSFGQAIKDQFYKIEKVNIPENINLEVGGLAFNDKGELGVITRRGELWIIKNPEAQKPTFNRFAHGLHEPLGLAFKEGSFYTNQRGELTKLTDSNNDNHADQYETITSWELNGNYHEYSYGPVILPDGDFLVTLNLGWIGRGESGSKWRGWMMKVSPDGTVKPYATGLRSPAGFGLNAAGDIFYTENQGDWVGSGNITHLELGDFAGSPEGLKWSGEEGSPLDLKLEDIDDSKGMTLYQYKEKYDAVKPPSVWLPHTLMGISTSDIAVIPENFGPFNDQLLVGDQGHSKIMRVYQEKVNGVYQGACFPFVDGFSSGVLRLIWSPEQDALYAGQTNRGWASTGRDPYALERLVWTGKTPFEIKQINIHAQGFQLEFTKPVHPSIANDLKAFQVTDFTYQYHHYYGSPVTDKQDRSVQKIELAKDGKTVMIYLDQIRKGYIYEIKSKDILSNLNEQLLHDVAYYTVNEIPKGHSENNTSNSSRTNTSNTNALSNLRITSMPESWNGKVDQVIEMGTIPGMKYDKELVKVSAGSKVKFTFNNPDDMPHNFILVNPGKADEIGEAALALGLDGEKLNYIPTSNEILAYTHLIPPTGVETIYFEAPEKPGDYQYVCTFPGHHLVMRGIFRVE